MKLAALFDHGEAIGEILTRRERAARAGDHDGADRRVRGAVRERRVERLGEGLVERVEHVRSVQREDRDRAVAFDAERGEARHFPLNVALRLFTKASTPSFLSSVAKSR